MQHAAAGLPTASDAPDAAVAGVRAGHDEAAPHVGGPGRKPWRWPWRWRRWPWQAAGAPAGGGRESLTLLPECAAILAFIAVIWASIWLMLEQQYRVTEHAAIRDARNLARAFEENTERIVAGIDQTLLSIRASYAEQGDWFRLQAWLRGHPLPDRFTVQISIIGPDGRLRESNIAASADSQIDLSDRPHFRAQIDPAHDDLYISRPVLGRVSRAWTVQFTRKLLLKDNSFAGVVVLSLGCDELSRFYDTLEVGQGIVMLAGTDGFVRARAPLRGGVIGSDITGHPAFRALPDRRSGEYRLVSPFDGVARLLSFRRLRDQPLIVIVGVGVDEMFESYRQARTRSLLTGGIATGFVLFLGTLWIVRRRRWLLAQRALGLTLESISQGIVMVDAAGTPRVMNRRAAALLGLPAPVGQADAGAAPAPLDSLHAEWRATLAPPPAALPAGESGASDGVGPELPDSIIEIAGADGKTVEVHRTPTPFGGMVVTYTDITDRKLAEARILHLALHDGLTGLPNRILLNQRIEQAIAQHGAPHGAPTEPAAHAFAIFCLDLDGFKAINDTMGHDAGDLVLSRIADRLRGLVRPADSLARTGGDSFAVLVRGPLGHGAAEEIARRLLSDLVMPVELGGYVADVGASIGIALFPDDGADGRVLLKNAATALSVAKAAQRGSFRRFESWMDQSAAERRVLERELRLAIETNQLAVHFQPQFATDSLRVTGFEALARWPHPERGMVPPGVFIPLAEESGLIVPIGRAVLEQACAQAALWQPPLPVAVNLSPVQFLDGNLVPWLCEVLERTGLPANRLELEVTEGVLIKDEELALGTLKALKVLGVELALDDFGTGYSGLSYLRRFPFDVIKIDKSFVHAQEQDFGTRAIVEAVIAMSARMKLRVIAEGIETEEQLALLREQGANAVQGFLLARPMPSGDVQAFLDSVAGGGMAARISRGATRQPAALLPITVQSSAATPRQRRRSDR